MAKTSSPTCRAALLPRLSGVSPVAETLSRARSWVLSVVTTLACATRPSEKVTLMAPADSAITWLFVTISPSARTTTPEPSRSRRGPGSRS
jgi:hypothetical protein